MEVNNSSLIVDERLPSTKGIGPLYFNALNNNKSKTSFFNKHTDSNKDDHQVLLRNHSRPIIIPKSASTNGSVVMENHQENGNEEEPIRPNIGDPNVVGLPLNLEDSAINNTTQKAESEEICDIKQIDVDSILPAPIYPTATNNQNSNKNQNSIKSWRSEEGRAGTSSATYSFMGKPFSDTSSQISRPFSDVMSIRSLASIGMGSTDGRKMIIRKVPQSPSELFNIVNPPT